MAIDSVEPVVIGNLCQVGALSNRGLRENAKLIRVAKVNANQKTYKQYDTDNVRRVMTKRDNRQANVIVARSRLETASPDYREPPGNQQATQQTDARRFGDYCSGLIITVDEHKHDILRCEIAVPVPIAVFPTRVAVIDILVIPANKYVNEVFAVEDFIKV